MAIFLSVQSIGKVVDKLIKGYGRSDVPVAIVYKASWKDEQIIFGTLIDIEEKVKEKGKKVQLVETQIEFNKIVETKVLISFK